jgi:Fic family protein
LGRYEAVAWQPPTIDGVPRARRQPGRYWAYVPDPLAQQTPLTLPGPTVERVAEATGALTAASRSAGAVDLDSLVSLALRSEAVASSVIEGVHASARSVALADFTGHGSPAALEVARNARLMRSATRELAMSDHVEVQDIVGLQSQLVPYLPGMREEQVWIGGSNPIVAAYVPPTHQRVPALMADLVGYLNEPQDAAIVAAAVVHGQFETIHPFRDGNGRVGRALTHTLLARAQHSSTGSAKGSSTVLPFSRVFAARRQSYIDGLVSWRTDDGNDTTARVDDRLLWIEVFADALIESAALAQQMAQRLAQLKQDHHERLSQARTNAGVKQPRRGSTVLGLLDGIAAHPIDTAATAARRLAVSTVAARDALEELASVGIHRTFKIDKGKTISYIAHEVLALADTPLGGGSVPDGDASLGLERPVPTRTQRARRRAVCGYPLPRAGAWCIQTAGHSGRHQRSTTEATSDNPDGSADG